MSNIIYTDSSVATAWLVKSGVRLFIIALALALAFLYVRWVCNSCADVGKPASEFVIGNANGVK